jgi:hypothetical protein
MKPDLSFQYPHPPTTEAAIANYEKELGFRLPEDYRQFLLKYNGGNRPSRSGFGYKYADGKAQSSAVDSFFGLGLEPTYNLKMNQNPQDKPDYLLMIGYDLGSWLGIGITSETKGQVYIWEHCRQMDVILLAKSFHEFLNMLEDSEDF